MKLQSLIPLLSAAFLATLVMDVRGSGCCAGYGSDSYTGLWGCTQELNCGCPCPGKKMIEVFKCDGCDQYIDKPTSVNCQRNHEYKCESCSEDRNVDDDQDLEGR
ncbi:hypothetical protein PCANC_25934 [Puccinia coronata f. sp. avenae]|nr:hypothetical protein PCANC_25934 [Puccinia coronata f. sp. avenae]PLW51322.1 hypothetical protein PCASD_01003 [Puccinia coronata f. sp. avenae]